MPAHPQRSTSCAARWQPANPRAKALAQEMGAVLIVQDDLLAGPLPGEILVIPDFVKYSARLRDTLAPHIYGAAVTWRSCCARFPWQYARPARVVSHTVRARRRGAWLHHIDTPTTLQAAATEAAQRRLTPAGAPWTTDAEFDAITVYFQPPARMRASPSCITCVTCDVDCYGMPDSG